MFNEWRERRELRKRIASLKKEEAARQSISAYDYFNEPEHKPEEMPIELKLLLHRSERELDELETSRLVRKARRRGIKFPSESSWWYEDNDYEGREVHYLTDIGKAGVSRLIREDRRASFEWWVSKVIVPLLTALISVLGLIVALVSVSKK